MSTPSMTVRKAAPSELDRVERLLEAAGLPSRDVRSKPDCFFVAAVDGEFVGVGGLERYGENALLRSIAIAESRRGRGLGTALCDELEARARANGVATLYLLTTTAAPFFRRLGYETIEREAVPASVRGTTEFAELCPASATCMTKDLER